MSGGVDSSTAAYLLRKAHPSAAMTAVTHWWDELEESSPGLQERSRRVCRKLGIPYRVLDLKDSFRSTVMENFYRSYLAGETPNPCVVCNGVIRFGLFYREVSRLLTAETPGDDDFFFSTGHYVRTAREEGRSFLRRAADPAKDQSYMLYRIPRERLPHLLFPLGEMTKETVKELAAEQGFFGTAIKESQDICFVEGHYSAFLDGYHSSHHGREPYPSAAGEIVDSQGRPLGRHCGYLHYTIGQRKGLGLGDGPWYVIGIDARRNRIIVGRSREAGGHRFRVRDLNWFIDPPEELECRVQIRYNSRPLPCRLTAAGEGVEVELERPEALTPGQSAVFYRGDLVLGGGMICR